MNVKPSAMSHFNDAIEEESAKQVLEGEYDIPLIPSPKRVLDIGANVGAFSIWARKRWPDAEIIAYEPQAEACSRYAQNVGNDAQLIQAAVKAEGGKQTMLRGEGSTCRASFRDLGWQSGESIEVECIDAKSLPPAEFIKLDIEGDELEVLKRLELGCARGIALEYHTEKDKDDIHSFLLSRGFHLHDRFPTLNGCGILKFTKSILQGRVFIAMPVYGVMQWWSIQSYVAMMMNPVRNSLFKPLVGDSAIGRSRNHLTADFLETNCSDLLFIDSDLIWSPAHISRITSHNVDLVGGCYAKKIDGPAQWVINALPDQLEAQSDGLHKVKYVGTGFMRIRRNVFTSMLQAFGEDIWYHDDNPPHRKEYDFWHMGVYRFPDGSRRYLSEDWWFCQKWLDLGGEVWADTGTVLKHVGLQTYPTQLT